MLGKLLMEHSVAPYHLSLPILKHMLGLPVAFSDLEFADAELYRNLQWLRSARCRKGVQVVLPMLWCCSREGGLGLLLV